MVESVSSSNSQKSSFADFKKDQSFNTYSPLTKPMPQDTIEINKKKKKTADPQKTMKRFQIASLVVGGVASFALLAIVGKTFIPDKETRAMVKRIKEADIPDYARKRLMQEYKKLKFSPIDGDIIKNYVDNVLRLNWKKPERKIVDIKQAEKILNEELKGLNNVKRIILDYIELQNHCIEHGVTDFEPLVLCLDGSPGVGKTTIANAIAKAMDRPFGRISLAGVSNEPFIKGLKKWYKGAEPGQIIKALQNANTNPKVNNPPVILLDELDKMGKSMEHGDPYSALIDALESKQCKNFTDQYLEIPYDLSGVVFIATSNNINNIPAVLRSRMQEVHINNFTNSIKKEICEDAKDKMFKKLGLDKLPVKVEQSAYDEIIRQTEDDGARKTTENLRIAIIKSIVKLRKNNYKTPITINAQFVKEALSKQA